MDTPLTNENESDTAWQPSQFGQHVQAQHRANDHCLECSSLGELQISSSHDIIDAMILLVSPVFADLLRSRLGNVFTKTTTHLFHTGHIAGDRVLWVPVLALEELGLTFQNLPFVSKGISICQGSSIAGKPLASLVVSQKTLAIFIL
ncbi:expressed unknown protein [Seminavis robusta]|uniref:Uncharacterized protein n=1 Tax=Seminavis robusta TaxID=568900 RepID=A0A9N8HSU1_9STRA|nr:expressed unknown protein [Seminavis robusta]|eukprot:Sro1771_g296661.1  (147) ;mRNA; f:21662-22102